MSEKALLISIKPSHYCEKVRWALEYLNIPYQEESHFPMFHLLANRKYKGNRTVPLLLIKDQILKDSTDILKYLDTKANNDLKLYPTDLEQLKEVDELEELFDTKLGTHTRRFAYFYLLPNKKLLIEKFSDNNDFETNTFSILFPLIKQMLTKFMNINEKTANISKEKVIKIFETVENKLSDGRKYLLGDTFTAADLTFASLATPVILPQYYWKDTDDKIPADFLKEVQFFRATKAGQYVLSLYESKRISS